MSDAKHSTPTLDGPGEVRDGETLDVDALGAWLAALPADSDGGFEGPLTVQQFRAGYSNLTYAVTVGERELVLRRPPFGNKIKSGHDMNREYRVLSKLAHRFPAAPRPVAECRDTSVIGAPFYLMERLRGVILRRGVPKGVTLSAEQARALGEALVDRLAELHALDYAAAAFGIDDRCIRNWRAAAAGR